MYFFMSNMTKFIMKLIDLIDKNVMTDILSQSVFFILTFKVRIYSNKALLSSQIHLSTVQFIVLRLHDVLRYAYLQ